MESNVQHQGGFLGMLAGLASKALPTLLNGLATGLLSGAVEKAVGGHGLHPSERWGGDGLYLHKSGHCINVEPTKGNGLQLTLNRLVDRHRGVGQYLKRGSQICDARGLLLGPNSPQEYSDIKSTVVTNLSSLLLTFKQLLSWLIYLLIIILRMVNVKVNVVLKEILEIKESMVIKVNPGEVGSKGEDGRQGYPGAKGEHGPQGSKGDPGRSGIGDMCRWIPNLTLEQFQKNETCCFKLTDPAKDLQNPAVSGVYVTEDGCYCESK